MDVLEVDFLRGGALISRVDIGGLWRDAVAITIVIAITATECHTSAAGCICEPSCCDSRE